MATKAGQFQDPGTFAPARVDPSAAACDSITAVDWSAMTTQIEDWDALAAEASEPNPFFESWYLMPSLRAFDPDGEIAILRFEHEGRLAGLMPLVRRAFYYRWPIPFMGNWMHANSFCGTPLIAKGSEVAFWQALLRWADENARLALFLHLRGIALDGVPWAALRGVLETEDRRWKCVHHEERALLASTQQPEAYWQASLSGKKRKELRRQARRLSEEGSVSIERLTDDHALDEWIESFLMLENAGWKGRGHSSLASDAATSQLFAESLAGAAARGKLERLALRLDGKPIAMLASFLSAPGAFSYKTAYDEAYSAFSPGVLLQRENLRLLTRDDIAWTDSCAAEGHPMIDHIWRERRGLARLNIAIGGSARRAIFDAVASRETSHPLPGDAA